MGIDRHSDALEERMGTENTLVADTEQPEKGVNDPDHGTRTPETKESPRTITGWKVSIQLDACLQFQ